MNSTDCVSASSPIKEAACLASYVGQTFIIAYKELTEPLEKALHNEGLSYEMLRQEPRQENIKYSPSYLCLMNHRRAWEKTLQQNTPSLIVEADFVPVIGMGQLPLPFNPQAQNVGIAWLYTCAPQVYSVSGEGYASGYSASTVAYLVTPPGAKALIELSEQIRAQYGETHYSSWDSEVDRFLRECQLKNFIPFRNYGEHGGLPNPEHRERGLSPSHRADILYNSLAFMPIYALAEGQEDRLKFFRVRLLARLKGIGRLVTGRYLRWKIVKLSKNPLRLIAFALSRHLTNIL